MTTWEIDLSADGRTEGSVKLQSGSLLLGSAKECAIVSQAEGVAPRHLEFVVRGDRLQLRIFNTRSTTRSTPRSTTRSTTRLNGALVQGVVDVKCPADITVGGLRVSVTEVGGARQREKPVDATQRLVHPSWPGAAPFTSAEDFDVTGRIILARPRGEGAAGSPVVAEASIEGNSLLEPEFSGDSTMAFAMDTVDLALEEKVPVRLDYAVKGEIARGGMGKIYSAADPLLKRLVALKVSTEGDSSPGSKFAREAEILAALEHPNIVPIHTLGADAAGRPFYSMKLVHGRTLKRILKQLAEHDPATVAVYTRQRLLDVFRKVCDAMAFAHTKGYLHRDLKPENIMVGEFGEVLVMDWGLAKRIRSARTKAASELPGEPEPEFLPYIEGTPQYMSPEQARGMFGALDERSDIYALGGILYAVLTLQPLVRGASLNEVLDKVRKGEAAKLTLSREGGLPVGSEQRASSVPEALRAVVLKALAKERERRYQRVEELAQDIEAYLGGFATQAEDAGFTRHMVLLVKRHRAVSALVGVGLVGALLFTVRLAASEQKARDNAVRAEQEAARAMTNADQARRNAARAEEQSRLARESERQAKRDREAARKSAARAQLALGEAAERAQNAEDIQSRLEEVPEDLRDQSWRYLSKVANSAESTITLNAAAMWHKFEPHPLDPDLLFTLHEDGWIRSVHLKTGAIEDVLHCNRGHPATSRLAFSPDGPLVAVCGLNPTGKFMQVDILDLRTGERKAGFEFPYERRAPYFQFSRDAGTLLVSLTPPARVFVFDIAKNEIRWSWSGKTGGLASLSNSEKTVSLYQQNEEVLEFSAADGREFLGPSPRSYKILRGETGVYENYAYSLDGTRFLAFSARTRSLRQFDCGTGKKLFDERLPSGTLLSKMVYLAQEDLVVTLSDISDGSAVVLVHSGSDGRVIQRHLVAMKKNVKLEWNLAVHPLSKQIIVVRGEQMAVFSMPTSPETHSFNISSHGVHDGFCFLQKPSTMLIPQSFTVASTRTQTPLKTVDLSVRERAITEKAFVFDSKEGTHPSLHMTSSADGRMVGVIYRYEKTLAIFRDEGNGLTEAIRYEVPFYATYTELSPSGRLLWTGGNVLLDAMSGKPVQIVDRDDVVNSGELHPVWLGESRVAEIATLLNDKQIDSLNPKGSAERALLLWDREAGKRTAKVLAPNATALAAAPDGAWLAEGGRDMRVRIRSGTTLEVERTLRVHDGPVVDVAWHPTLPLLATASEDFSVKVWDLATDTLVEEFRTRPDAVPTRLRWSPDGRLLAVSHQGSTPHVKVYEPKACQALPK